MRETETSASSDPAGDAAGAPHAAALGAGRARRRAEREVRRALSETRAIATWAAFAICSQVFGFAFLAANGRLTLVFGVLTFATLVALGAHMEPEPPRPPKGEIAKLAQPAFEELVQVVEAQGEHLATSQGADAGAAAHETQDDDGFVRLVSEALDDLPLAFRWELERNVPVIVSDDGASHGAYGLYMGATVAHPGWTNRIVIFRDTLLRDYGGDPEALRRIVTMVVRHELAHHLGAGERRVAQLGLYDVRGPRPAKPLRRPPEMPWSATPCPIRRSRWGQPPPASLRDGRMAAPGATPDRRWSLAPMSTVTSLRRRRVFHHPSGPLAHRPRPPPGRPPERCASGDEY